MVDLQLVDFALVAERKVIWATDNFSSIDVTILSWTSYPTSGFTAVFHNEDWPRFSGLQNVVHNKGEQEISTFPLSEVEIMGGSKSQNSRTAEKKPKS